MRLSQGSHRRPTGSRSPSAAADFIDRLAQMSGDERIRAARNGGFSHAERALWAARYPEEVPIVNDELEWIALTLADLD
jgi:hypothetical protein